MTQSEPLPHLNFRTTGMPDAAAFARWRELMAPLFAIEKAPYTSALPRGNLWMVAVGEIIVSRNTFNAQHLTRDPALIAATPNHLILHYYKSGGYRGTIAGHPVCIVRGQVSVCDLGQETDAYAATSETVGLSLPRSLLDGVDPAALTRQLDAPRNRLLGGAMAGLPRRVKRMGQGDVPALTAELTGLLKRVFADGDLGDAAEAATADETVLAGALGFIESNLGARDLDPARLAARVGVSRGTLYRLFAPMGGIMRYVQERRLEAVRDVLNDALDRRSLADLAAAHGFANQALLSRGFRARFGVSPRDWRQQALDRGLATSEASVEPVHGLWRDLGRGDGASGDAEP